jgi:hypothetical protein
MKRKGDALNDGPGLIEKREGMPEIFRQNTHFKSEKQDSFKSYVARLLEKWIACMTASNVAWQ